MGEQKVFFVDAFASRLFTGNPAAVVPLETWPDDGAMQSIAMEHNLSETAFFAPTRGGADFHLRWFTPRREVALCGHATLATAHVLFEHLGFGKESVRFTTERSGVLGVAKVGSLLELDFPARPCERIEPPAGLNEALGRAAAECYRAGEDVLAVYDSKRHIHALEPDFRALSRVETRGVIVTAPGAGHDFVSRFFVPRYGIDEDPVTGSAHCALTTYWAARLGKRELTAHQVSARGGEIACRLAGDRVHLGGRCVTYLEGTIRV